MSFTGLFFAACNSTTSKEYFEQAVLNSNMLNGFADERGLPELEYGSAKLQKDGSTATMPRKEILEEKTKSLQEALDKIKGLDQTADTKEMILTSIELYEYVLPVYKTEYAQLAKAYDENASKETIKSETQVIHDKYYTHYNELYGKLISIGKVYAEKHSIKVNWNVGA